MQRQITDFATFPLDVLELIFAKLDASGVKNINSISTTYNGNAFFQKKLYSHELIHHVMSGDLIAAEKCAMRLVQLPHGWKSILNKASGVELYDRLWKSVSPLEYSGWIGNTFMRKMLLKCLPLEAYKLAHAQLLMMKHLGLEHGKRQQPFEEFIKACDIFNAGVNSYPGWNELNQKNIREVVRLQYQLSCFGLQLMSDPSFNAESSFDKPLESRVFKPESFVIDCDWDESSFLFKLPGGKWISWAHDYLVPPRVLPHGEAYKKQCQVESKSLDEDLLMLKSYSAQAVSNVPNIKN